MKFWNSPWILAISAGLLLGVSFAPFDLALAQIPAFIFLLRATDMSTSARELTAWLYPAFIIWNAITTYWLIFATVAGGIAAILANSLIMVVPFLFIRRLLKGRYHYLIVSLSSAALWTAYEFLHHNWDLAWTWLALGNGWANYPSLIQYISVTGYLGISFWIVLSSSLFYFTLTERSKPVFYKALTVLLIFPLFSVISMYYYQQDSSGETVEVAVVQPNMDSYIELGGYASFSDLLNAHIAISDSARTPDTDLIVWPENATDTALGLESSTANILKDTLRKWNSALITGSSYIRYYDSGQVPELTSGTYNSIPYNVFNAAFYLNPSQKNQVYEKGKLVPMVERFPFVNFLSSLDKKNWINWQEIMGYGKGNKATLFEVDGYQTTALICYDSVFPGWVRQFVVNGADFLTIVTNDGWWGNTSGHIQHFAYARLRAVEFRRWIVRSANNGISGIISPDGDVKVETEYWKRTGFTYRVPIASQMTFYAVYGDWFNWMITAFAAFGVVLSLFKTGK